MPFKTPIADSRFYFDTTELVTCILWLIRLIVKPETAVRFPVLNYNAINRVIVRVLLFSVCLRSSQNTNKSLALYLF